jgi:hypothetical protein
MYDDSNIDDDGVPARPLAWIILLSPRNAGTRTWVSARSPLATPPGGAAAA